MVDDKQDKNSYRGLGRMVLSLLVHLSVFFIYVLFAYLLRFIGTRFFGDSEPISFAFRIGEQVLIYGGVVLLLVKVLNDITEQIRSSRRKK
jgi:uncharacterized membrane protein (DUF485 family)